MNEHNQIKIEQNLRDAGVDKATIKTFMSLEELRKTEEQLSILSKHRKNLLDIYHEDQRKIDCLDFLIFCIRQRNETNCDQSEDNK